jgi:hypothetical protein
LLFFDFASSKKKVLQNLKNFLFLRSLNHEKENFSRQGPLANLFPTNKLSQSILPKKDFRKTKTFDCLNQVKIV